MIFLNSFSFRYSKSAKRWVETTFNFFPLAIFHESSFRLTQPNSDLMNSITTKKKFLSSCCWSQWKLQNLKFSIFFPFNKLVARRSLNCSEMTKMKTMNMTAILCTRHYSNNHMKDCVMNEVTIVEETQSCSRTNRLITPRMSWNFTILVAHDFFFCKSLLLARTLCWWLLSSSIIVIIICQHNLRPRHNFHGDTSNNWIFKWNSAEMTVFNLELSGGWCSMARIGISKKVCVFLWPELCWWHFYDSIVSDNRSQSRQSMLNVRITVYFMISHFATLLILCESSRRFLHHQNWFSVRWMTIMIVWITKHLNFVEFSLCETFQLVSTLLSSPMSYVKFLPQHHISTSRVYQHLVSEFTKDFPKFFRISSRDNNEKGNLEKQKS